MNWFEKYSAGRPPGPIFYKHDDENFNPDDQRHGTTGGYSKGCRCDKCKQAKSDELQRHKEKKLRELINNPDDPRHGTPGGGMAGCPCRPCQSAREIAMFKTRIKGLSELTDNPDDPRHGTLNGYSYGCRCDKCKDIMAEHKAEKYYSRTSSWNRRYAIDMHSTGIPWSDDYIFNHPDAQSPVMLDPKEIIKHYIPMHTWFPNCEYPEESMSPVQLWSASAHGIISGIHPSFSEEIRNNGVKNPIMVYHSTDGPLLGRHPGVVLDGHHRLLESIRQGIDKVPVSFIPAPKKDIEDRLDVDYQ